MRAFVRPALVPASSLVAHVEGSKNLVMATGQYAGQMVFSGFGAGGDPTAVAVVSDLYSIARGGGAPPGNVAGNRDAKGRERRIHRALLFAICGEGPSWNYRRGGDRTFPIRHRHRRGIAAAGISRIPLCRSSSRWKRAAARSSAALCRKSTGWISMWSRFCACRFCWIRVTWPNSEVVDFLPAESMFPVRYGYMNVANASQWFSGKMQSAVIPSPGTGWDKLREESLFD